MQLFHKNKFMYPDIYVSKRNSSIAENWSAMQIFPTDLHQLCIVNWLWCQISRLISTNGALQSDCNAKLPNWSQSTVHSKVNTMPNSPNDLHQLCIAKWPQCQISQLISTNCTLQSDQNAKLISINDALQTDYNAKFPSWSPPTVHCKVTKMTNSQTDFCQLYIATWL